MRAVPSQAASLGLAVLQLGSTYLLMLATMTFEVGGGLRFMFIISIPPGHLWGLHSIATPSCCLHVCTMSLTHDVYERGACE